LHGKWHDELAMESESRALADVDETAFENQHVQHLVRAYYGDRVGIGVLEQIVMGPYKPYRMEGAFDAPSYD
jgi:hypothetical protein